MKGLKLEVKALVITCLEQHLDDLIRAVEEADITFLDATAAPLAASYVALTKAQRMAGCILVNIGAETTSVVVSENGLPVSLEIFPVGSTNITNDIALGLQISLEDAELVKIGESSVQYPRKRLNDIIENCLEGLFDLILRHLQRIGRNGLLPAGVVLIGGGSRLPSIEEFARSTLELPAKIADISLDLSPQNGEKRRVSRDAGWFVAYGLCVFGASGGLGERRTERGIMDRFMRVFKDIARQFLP
jgi:cell division protein FtsA